LLNLAVRGSGREDISLLAPPTVLPELELELAADDTPVGAASRPPFEIACVRTVVAAPVAAAPVAAAPVVVAVAAPAVIRTSLAPPAVLPELELVLAGDTPVALEATAAGSPFEIVCDETVDVAAASGVVAEPEVGLISTSLEPPAVGMAAVEESALAFVGGPISLVTVVIGAVAAPVARPKPDLMLTPETLCP